MFVVYKYSSLLEYICRGLQSHGAQMKCNNMCNEMNRYRSGKKNLKVVFSSTNDFCKRYSPSKEYAGLGCLHVHLPSKYNFSSSSYIIKTNGCQYLVQL